MSSESDALNVGIGKNQCNNVYQILILVRYYRIDMPSGKHFSFFGQDLKKKIKKNRQRNSKNSTVARLQAVKAKSKPMKIQICKDQCICYLLLHSKLS